MRSKREALGTAPKYLRANPSRGAEPTVDRQGGFRRQGIIRRASIVTRGEALGHFLWLDSEFLQSVADRINQFNKGIKSRFTHPSLSGDGLGTFLGRTMNAEVVGDQVLADIHFTDAGHSTPDGDLATYVMDLAEQDPDTFGVSIVFSPDLGAEDRFTAEHEDENGKFHSPDADNASNLPHARLATLHASDVVDDPAANPGGLFHREQEFAEEADALAAFALGLTDNRPATVSLGLDADRIRGFVQRFIKHNQLEVWHMSSQEKSLDKEPATNPSATDQKKDDPKPALDTVPMLTPEIQVAAKPFLDRFGEKGAGWFLAGKNMDECWVLHCAEQEKTMGEEIARLNAKLGDTEKRVVASSAGEQSPVSGGSAEPKKRAGFASRFENCPALAHLKN